MAKQIPPNFDEHWDGANVLLRAQKSDGKALGEKSSYFNAMFFSGFKEAYEDSVEVPCSYKCMLNILRTIHSGEGRLVGVTVGDLAEMYRAADMFDIPSITSMYFENFGTHTAVIAMTAVTLGNHDMLMNCLEKMSNDALMKFMQVKNTSPMFSKKDAVSVYEKIDNVKVEKYNDPMDVFENLDLGLPMVAIKNKNIERDRTRRRIPDSIFDNLVIIDLTKKSNVSDIAISTKSSDGKLLYVKKEISEKFNEMFLTSNDADSDGSSIHVDVDYKTMETILYILHECHPAVNPLLLYDMYLFAKKFESSSIVEFVSDSLGNHSSGGYIEVALKLDMPNLVPKILANIKASKLSNWLLSADKDLIYHADDGEEVAISSKDTDLNLSLNDLHCIYKTLHSHNFPMRYGSRNGFQPRRGSRRGRNWGY